MGQVTNKTKHKRPSDVVHGSILTPLNQAEKDPTQHLADQSIGSQAQALQRLGGAQQQALMSRIGKTQGNQHAQRVVRALPAGKKKAEPGAKAQDEGAALQKQVAAQKEAPETTYQHVAAQSESTRAGRETTPQPTNAPKPPAPTLNIQQAEQSDPMLAALQDLQGTPSEKIPQVAQDLQARVPALREEICAQLQSGIPETVPLPSGLPTLEEVGGETTAPAAAEKHAALDDQLPDTETAESPQIAGGDDAAPTLQKEEPPAAAQRSIDPGPNPQVNLSGEANPAQLGAQHSQTNAAVEKQQTHLNALLNTGDFGENDLYPQIERPEFSVPRLNVTLPAAAPSSKPPSDGSSAGPTIQRSAAPQAQPAEQDAQMQAKIDALTERYTQQRAAYHQQLQSLQQQSEAKVAALSAEVREQQLGLQEQAHSEIAAAKAAGEERQEEIVTQQCAKSDTLHQETEKKVGTQVEQSETKTAKRLSDTEQKAAQLQAAGEQRAHAVIAAAQQRATVQTPTLQTKRVMRAAKGHAVGQTDNKQAGDSLNQAQQEADAIRAQIEAQIAAMITAAQNDNAEEVEAARLAVVALIEHALEEDLIAETEVMEFTCFADTENEILVILDFNADAVNNLAEYLVQDVQREYAIRYDGMQTLTDNAHPGHLVNQNFAANLQYRLTRPDEDGDMGIVYDFANTSGDVATPSPRVLGSTVIPYDEYVGNREHGDLYDNASQQEMAVRMLLGESGPGRILNNSNWFAENTGKLYTVFNRLDPAHSDPGNNDDFYPYAGCGPHPNANWNDDQINFNSCVLGDAYRTGASSYDTFQTAPQAIYPEMSQNPLANYRERDNLMHAQFQESVARIVILNQLVSRGLTPDPTLFHWAATGEETGAVSFVDENGQTEFQNRSAGKTEQYNYSDEPTATLDHQQIPYPAPLWPDDATQDPQVAPGNDSTPQAPAHQPGGGETNPNARFDASLQGSTRPIVGNQAVNFRSGPDINQAAVTGCEQIPLGESVTLSGNIVFDTDTDYGTIAFVEVSYGGHSGWIAASYVALTLNP